MDMAPFAKDQSQAEKATATPGIPGATGTRSPTVYDGSSGNTGSRGDFAPQRAANAHTPLPVSPGPVLQPSPLRPLGGSRSVSSESSDSRYRNYPVGHPWFARCQADSHNGSYFRAFKYARHRLLHYRHGRIAFLTKALMGWEQQHQDHLNGLTTAQKRLPGHVYVPECYDAWMEELDKEVKAFDELLLRNRDIQTLDRISENERAHMMAGFELRREDGTTYFVFDDELRDLWDDPDDTIICTKKQIHASLDWLLYSECFKCVLRTLFPDDNGNGHRLAQNLIVGFLKTVTVMTVNAVLIAPVMLLYFGNLSQVHSCLVVVSFSFLFTTIVSTRQDISLYATFIASAAFVAMLSTFLAQLQSCATT